MDFINLVIKFIPQYKGRIVTYVCFNFLSSICSAFSFVAIIPLIQILFKLSDKTFAYIEITEYESFLAIVEVVKNNIMYYLQEQIAVCGESNILLKIGAFVILMSFLSNLISYFAYWVRIPIRTGISRDLRKDAYEKITNMPIGMFSKENRGDFVSRMTSDVEETDYGIGITLDMFIKDPIQIIVYLVTMVSISSRLTVYAIAMILFVCALVLALGQTMQKISYEAQNNRGRILSSFEQTLGILPIIKSFNAQQSFQDKFNKLNLYTQETFNRQNRFYSLAWPSTDFLITLIIVVMLCSGGNLILSGASTINPAVFIGFLGVLYSMISPIRDMMKCTFGIRKAMASVARLNKILSITNENVYEEDRSDDEISFNDGSVIEFKDLTFKYGTQTVLDKISFKIDRGQKVAVLGPTGSGKSTLLSLLTCFYDDYEGVIEIAGKDIRSYTINTVRENIALVPQNSMLLNTSIKENITLSNEKYTESNIITSAQIANVHDFITMLNDQYDTIIGDRGCDLSGGQQQCISLARAIIKDAPILLVDEGTSAMDSELESSILSNLFDKMEGKTMIIISHKISSVLKADIIYVINEGKIVDSGSPKELYNKEGYFRSMAEIQNIKL